MQMAAGWLELHQGQVLAGLVGRQFMLQQQLMFDEPLKAGALTGLLYSIICCHASLHHTRLPECRLLAVSWTALALVFDQQVSFQCPNTLKGIIWGSQLALPMPKQ